MKPLQLAHELMQKHLKLGDYVMDGTLGNGHDALFLARCVGEGGRLLGFDVQASAIEATRHRLREAGFTGLEARLWQKGHEHLAEHLEGPLDGAMFNFGYLPGSDKQLITQSATSLKALKAALSGLREGGLMTLMCYPGHEGGDVESQSILDWAFQLDREQQRVLRYGEHQSGSRSPFLLAIWKR